MAMNKTNRLNTPGGTPVKLVNPLSYEVGPMDSGEDQLLLKNIERRSSKMQRTPPNKFTSGVTSSTTSNNAKDVNNISEKGTMINEEIDITDQQSSIEEKEKDQSKNYFDEWQIEIAARKQLELLVQSLQLQVKKLEEKVSLLDKKNSEPTLQLSPKCFEPEYQTDEEELLFETEKKKNKRITKKRKPNGSPEICSRHQKSSKSENDKKLITQTKEANNMVADAKSISHAKGSKKITPPPIMISGFPIFGDLKKIIEKCTKKACKYTSYNKDNWKVTVEEADEYRSVTEELSKHQIQWHSYENKATRPIKVVARGLHFSCSPEEVVEDLVQKGFQALDAVNLFKNETIKNSSGESTTSKRLLPLFMLTFDSKQSVEEIYKVRSILGIAVKIEPLRKSKNVPQCKRCQAFGHTQKYCNREFACVKCEGKHATKNCPKSKDQKAKCVNCQGNHPASYRGCPVAKKFQEFRSKNTSAGDKPRSTLNTNLTAENNTKNEPPKKAVQSKSDENKVYSQIVKNVRKNEETSIKEMLQLILQRIDKQDLNIKQLSEKVALKKQ